jgi:hypothetical protein
MLEMLHFKNQLDSDRIKKQIHAKHQSKQEE